MTRRTVLALAFTLGLVTAGAIAWSARPTDRSPAVAGTAPPAPMPLQARTIDEIAEGYVKLALAVGRYDEDYVDAYFGPPAWREASRGIARARIAPEGRRLRRALDAPTTSPPEGLSALRRAWLGAHLDALVAVMERLDGHGLSFEDEVRVVYDVDVPPFDETENAAVLAELDALLPGEGRLATRYLDWYRAHSLPAQAWDVAFRAAIAECRKRTLAFVDLPPDEEVEIEYVSGQPWNAFNQYHGDYRSVVQVNRRGRLPILDALEFACHEAYPGHHVLGVLQERHLVEERGWVEFAVHALYGPGAVIAEGTACQADAVIFPGEERDAFLAETLFPLVGLDPEDAATVGRIGDLVNRLDDARVEATRRMRAPGGDRLLAAAWLAGHSHLSPSGALGDMGFAVRYGSYTVTYAVGSARVRAWLDAGAREGGPGEPERFAGLLGRPCLPRDLRDAAPR